MNMNYDGSATAPPSDEKSRAGAAHPPPYSPYQQPIGFNQPQLQPQQGYGPYGHAQYQGQPGPGGVIVTQPVAVVAVAPVNDYLGYSIFTMICCCLPLGIAALVYSISARDALAAGDMASAQSNSRTARTLNHVALAIGICVMITWIVLVSIMFF